MADGRLRIYLGAAPGVGKTYGMLCEAHRRRERGTDVVVGLVETHGRPRTATMLDGLETVSRRVIDYRGATFTELDVDAILARRPTVVLIDELAHSNVPGSRNAKRWQDVNELLDAGIDVLSTLNIQHLESLNDVVERITGVPQRETVPDAVVRGAAQVELVDMTPEALRRRMAHGNVYTAEKIDAALGNYFRVGNLTALRELALRQLATDQAGKSDAYRDREGLQRPVIPEKVMVAIASRGSARTLLRVGSRIAGRLSSDWFAVYVETPHEEAGRIKPEDHAALEDNIRFAKQLGAKLVKLKGARVADALVEFAKREGITHVIFGQSARSRWNLLVHGSIVDRFLREVRNATVQIVPVDREASAAPDDTPGE